MPFIACAVLCCLPLPFPFDGHLDVCIKCVTYECLLFLPQRVAGCPEATGITAVRLLTDVSQRIRPGELPDRHVHLRVVRRHYQGKTRLGWSSALQAATDLSLEAANVFIVMTDAYRGNRQ